MKREQDYRLVDIHSHHQDSHTGSLIRINNLFYQDMIRSGVPNHPVSVALHPWHIGSHVFDRQVLWSAAKTNLSIVAIGETGLDRRCLVPFEDQIRVFTEHVQLADQLGVPLIIHAVKSFDEILRLKKALQPASQWIIHGFRGGLVLADQLLSAGICLSFGRALLHPSDGLRRAVQITPPDQFFLETDEDDVSIGDLYLRAAEIRGISQQELVFFVYQNFLAVFTRYAQNRLEGTNGAAAR